MQEIPWESMDAEAEHRAGLFGAVAYGTYEFTNLATLKPWHWSMVALDLTWGTFLTTVAAVGGVTITRAFT